MINRVILVGNLTRDAESVSTNGKSMTRMRIATNNRWRDSAGNRQEATEYHTAISFGRLAEICALYCTKGKLVYVEGRLRTREFETADKSRRTSTEIVAETVRMLQGRSPVTGAEFEPGSEPVGSEQAELEEMESAVA